jgi:signal transduction histidine kinase
LSHALKPEQLKSVTELIDTKFEEQRKAQRLSALKRIERENDLVDWFSGHELDDLIHSADTFVESGFVPEELENVVNEVGKQAAADVLVWIENILSSANIIYDLEEASTRISTLVGAIKSHVHMDRTHETQCCTDLHKDIDNTLTLLGYKIREKQIRVQKFYDENLPEIEAYIGELNQVWTNLIDNAVFALPPEGDLKITTRTGDGKVEVIVSDNGPGVPVDIQSRIFDPFFTTKKQGEGTGIGLDLVKRIINRHSGDISLFSKTGHTEFKVVLPLRQTKA